MPKFDGRCSEVRLMYAIEGWITKLFQAPTPQEVFDKVIRKGYYSDAKHSKGYTYMCVALSATNGRYLITDKTYRIGQKAISDYLKDTDHCTLQGALEATGLPYAFEDRLNIYKDWDNRPKLISAVEEEMGRWFK